MIHAGRGIAPLVGVEYELAVLIGDRVDTVLTVRTSVFTPPWATGAHSRNCRRFKKNRLTTDNYFKVTR